MNDEPMALSDRDLKQTNERIVHVEEELKAQRELMQRGCDEMERRFGQVERRFRGQTWLMGVGFVLISTLMSLYAFLA
ncbi:MAG: hypothetical protein ACOC7V_14160 [Spirochaetota bacterium]